VQEYVRLCVLCVVPTSLALSHTCCLTAARLHREQEPLSVFTKPTSRVKSLLDKEDVTHLCLHILDFRVVSRKILAAIDVRDKSLDSDTPDRFWNSPLPPETAISIASSQSCFLYTCSGSSINTYRPLTVEKGPDNPLITRFSATIALPRPLTLDYIHQSIHFTTGNPPGQHFVSRNIVGKSTRRTERIGNSLFVNPFGTSFEFAIFFAFI